MGRRIYGQSGPSLQRSVFTHYIYRRAARKEKEKHIVSLILFFRLYRSVRKFFSWEPHISRFLLKKEKYIYDTYCASMIIVNCFLLIINDYFLLPRITTLRILCLKNLFLINICAVMFVQKCRDNFFVITQVVCANGKIQLLAILE